MSSAKWLKVMSLTARTSIIQGMSNIPQRPSESDVPAGHAREDYLNIGSITVYVRDQALSRQFYLERLGFGLVFDSAASDDDISHFLRSAGLRWLAVGPMVSARPMLLGAALALLKPAEGSEQARRIGTHTGVTFFTNDIAARHKEWHSRRLC